jgi:hypothetical protein
MAIAMMIRNENRIRMGLFLHQVEVKLIKTTPHNTGESIKYQVYIGTKKGQAFQNCKVGG